MNKTDTLGDVIYQIARDHGEQTLTNTQRMLAMFVDIAPTLRKEKELLRAFLMCDGASMLLQVREKPDADQKVAMEKMVKMLYDEQGIAEAAARQVCAAFYYGITGRIWKFDTPEAKHVPNALSKSKSKIRKTKNLDVHTTARVKNLHTHAGRNTTVNLDGETIHIQIPPNTVAGQECKFTGKGKVDPQTGNRGDLYVMVELQNSRWPSGLKILAAAVVAVLLMLIGFLLFSPGDSDKESGNSLNNADDAVVQGHTHRWRDATCEAPKTCVTCGATSGTKSSHEWNSATYTAPKTCSVCGAAEGISLGTPLSKCTVLKDSQSPKKTDITTGTAWDTSGNKHENAIKFWVSDAGTYVNVEYIVYQLSGNYDQLNGLITLGEDSEPKASVRFYIYGDGKLLHISDHIEGQKTETIQLDVSGIEEIKIECDTEAECHCYGIFAATLHVE